MAFRTKTQFISEGFSFFRRERLTLGIMYEAGMDVPSEFEIIDFKGGLYAVATDIDRKTDMDAMSSKVDNFLAENGLERDPSRPELGNIITSPNCSKLLGYEQMDYFFPIKAKE